MANIELPTAKGKKGFITTVRQLIGHFDRVYQSHHPDALMRIISGGSKIHSVAKTPVAGVKGVSAWKGTAAVKAAVTKETAEAVGTQAVKVAGKEMAEAVGTQAVKVAGKETAEAVGTQVAKEVAEASATKCTWVPGISLGIGAAFGLYCVVCGMHLISRGKKFRGGEEFVKAGLELTSGAVACIPGTGTGFSLILDGFIAAWDVADMYMHCEEADKERDIILLRGDLVIIEEGIENGEYSTMEFAGCVLREIIKKFPATDNEQNCVDFAIYLNLLVKLVRDNLFFKSKSEFSTENLHKEMKEIGFSKKQIGLFHAKMQNQ